MADSISAVTTPVTPAIAPEPKKVETQPIAPAVDAKPAETTGATANTTVPTELGAGVAQGTPPEGAAHKLYMTA